ncbi:hypothetical protein SBRCBS47491_004028 [Sporothrix bragantina]|uniref:Acyltransferase 3 domain-containing protein n=1 Tax=Sporothrix bragantina TaxID=671064 RepID=A0ABP0BKC5_9PEZI
MTLSRLRTHIRQAANIMLAGYCLACGKWAAFEFLVGLFLAELHILRKASKSVFAVGHFLGYNRQLSHTVQRRILAASHNLYVAFHATILGVCLFVAGWPNEDADKSPGIRVLQVNTPAWFLRNADSQVVKGIVPADGDAIFEQKFWFGVTAVGIVWSCGELTAVRRLFETPPAQYCGRISYAMYLVHGPALDYFQEMVLGRPAVRYMADNSLVSTETGTGIKGWIGVETPTQRVLSWLVGVVVLGGIIVWIADLFWRFVDAPIVKLGQAVERACTRPIHAQSVSLEAKEHNLSSEEGISVLVG